MKLSAPRLGGMALACALGCSPAQVPVETAAAPAVAVVAERRSPVAQCPCSAHAQTLGSHACFGDSLWSSAAQRDPIDLARLARREGSRSLISAAYCGEPTRSTALTALPYAADAALLLDQLCAPPEALAGEALEHWLQMLLGVVSAEHAETEAANESKIACALDLGRYTTGSKRVGDLVQSIRQALVQRD